MNNAPPDKYEIIIGGGPVGCYLAYKLLQTGHNKQDDVLCQRVAPL